MLAKPQMSEWALSKMNMTFSIWSFLLERLPLSERIWKQAGYLYDFFFGINWLIIEFLIKKINNWYIVELLIPEIKAYKYW